MIQRINQPITVSFNDILLCSENIHLLCSFCSGPLWGLSLGQSHDTRQHAPSQRRNTGRLTCTNTHTGTRTLESVTVRDKSCLTLWPGETGWLSSGEMKILLTKFPWAKQVVSPGNLDADFYCSRATCQSKRPPNSHSESWRTLSPRYKLVDWQLNARTCSVHIKKRKKSYAVIQKQVRNCFLFFTLIDLLLHTSWIFSFLIGRADACFWFFCWQRLMWVHNDTEDF